MLINLNKFQTKTLETVINQIKKGIDEEKIAEELEKKKRRYRIKNKEKIVKEVKIWQIIQEILRYKDVKNSILFKDTKKLIEVLNCKNAKYIVFSINKYSTNISCKLRGWKNEGEEFIILEEMKNYSFDRIMSELIYMESFYN